MWPKFGASDVASIVGASQCSQEVAERGRAQADEAANGARTPRILWP